MADARDEYSSQKLDGQGGAVMARHRMTFVRVYRYPASATWNQTDMIGMPVSMWRRLYPEERTGDDRPVFVSLGGGAVVGRVRPDPDLNWEPDRVDVPEWMWLMLGAPDWGTPTELDNVELHDVGHLVLRPRHHATLVALGDPVATLTAELSSGRWAALQTGMELVLECGVWDVLRVVDVVGDEVLAGCILNQDVTVELEAALREPTPPPPVSPSILLPAATGGAATMSFPGMTTPAPVRRPGGFIPFSGKGHTLGGNS